MRAVEDLVAIGVHGLKIEGRQKGAAYVLTATQAYRHWVDAVARGAADADRERVAGRPAPREPRLHARVLRRLPRRVGSPDARRGTLPQAPRRLARPRRARAPERRDRRARRGRAAVDRRARRRRAPHGARGDAVRRARRASRRGRGERRAPRRRRSSCAPGWASSSTRATPRTRRSRAGPSSASTARRAGGGSGSAARARPRRAWRRASACGSRATRPIAREAERAVADAEPAGRIAMTLSVRGRAGEPLARRGAGAARAGVRVVATSALVASTGGGLDEALLREKLGAFGGTPFRLDALDLGGLAPGLHLPVSELKALRRRVVEALRPAVERGPVRAVAPDPVLPSLRAAPRSRAARGRAAAPPPAPLSPGGPARGGRSKRGSPRSSSTGWSWSASRRPSRGRGRRGSG